MSAHGFKSLFMAASVAGAALGCYLVSLNVASERAKLEAVEEEIVLAERDIRLLQTEIGTRGRLAQLERWNARFIRLSAPAADQFVEGGFQLAAMVRPQPRPAIDAPVILAAAPAEQAVARPIMTSDDEDAPAPGASKPGAPAQMLHTASYAKPERAPGEQPKKPAAAKPVKSATADPLAPLPTSKQAARGGAPRNLPVTAKDHGSAQ